ncbi:glycosyltransferase family 2 protein [Paratractidigestivibacter sp.]|uniref:glycosyltransferase family 2 protein n=1 Tax=Paratractidigestivibacter sp. TaxID=2847316 RepID=UPI002ABE959F|nr:glycosyltransferase family 2 protein [Paratractidigestivibacter sp.]
MKVLAVIPAFNEEECIEATVAELKATCPSINYLVVNDGSRDSTEAICKSKGITIASLPINTGLASGFRTGMKYAWRHDFDAVIQFDADGQHKPDFIPAMIKEMQESNADIVIASRYLDGKKPEGARGVGSRLISSLIKLTTGTTITDPTSGMRLFNRKMIEHFVHDFDISPEPDTVALMARKGLKITEISAEMRDRQGGESYFDIPHIVGYMSRMCASIVLFQWFR